MILFPAIDLVGGRVVRLQRGDRSKMDVYSDDPASVARDFAAAGAEWIHVVDLSATFEEDEEACAANAAAIRAVCQVPGVSVDCGGGVRSMAAVSRLADLGVRRIAIGTISEVVQTIPRGLLTAKSTGASLPDTATPSHATRCPGISFCPTSATRPSIVTRPSAIRRSASRREQMPASLKKRFKRIPSGGIRDSCFSPGCNLLYDLSF